MNAECCANLLGAAALGISDRLLMEAASRTEGGGETPTALALIGLNPGLSVDALSRILQLSHSGAVRLADRLVAAGLVQKQAGADARTRMLRLTALGEARRAGFLDGRQNVLNTLLAKLDEEERQQLEKLLWKLLHAMPEVADDAWRICRLCDAGACANCPMEARFGVTAAGEA